MPYHDVIKFSGNRHDQVRIRVLLSIFSIISISLKRIFCFFIYQKQRFIVFLSCSSFWFSNTRLKKVYRLRMKNPRKNNQNEQPLSYLPQPHPRTILCTYNYWKTHPTKHFAIKFTFLVPNKNIWVFFRFFAVAISIFQSWLKFRATF